MPATIRSEETVPAAVLEEVVRRLVAAAHPSRIILFGSQVGGQAAPDSDVDLLVVERDVADRAKEMVRLGRTLRGLALPVDLLVADEELFARWSDTPGSVYFDAKHRGRTLYESR
jgi:predicted nucleotidyltransferase